MALLGALADLADDDGFAEARFVDLAERLGKDDPTRLAAHLRALQHVGIIERYTRPGLCNRYRLRVERLPNPSAASTPERVAA